MKTITLKTVSEQGELTKEDVIQLHDGAMLIHKVKCVNGNFPEEEFVQNVHNSIAYKLSHLEENNINLITVPEWSSFEVIDSLEE